MRWGLVCLALLVPLVGCVAETGSIEAGVEADRDRLQPGERVNVTATFANEGLLDYTYEHRGCPPELVDVWVEAPSGPIGLYPYGEEPLAGACVVGERSLEAGESLTVTVQWNGRTEPSPASPHEGAAVPAGDYTIRAELVRVDEGPTFASTTTITVAR